MRKLFLSIKIWICLISHGEDSVYFKVNELSDPINHQAELREKLVVIEKDLLSSSDYVNSRLFPAKYGDSTLQNATNWQIMRSSLTIDSIALVFSNNYSDLVQFNTSFYQLLAARLKNLFSFAPELNNSNIKFKVIIQTNCSTEACAMKLYHGIILYRNREQRQVENKLSNLDTLVLSPGVVPKFQNSCGAVGFNALDIISFENALWVSSDSLGIFTSKDSGETFTSFNTGLNTQFNYRLVIFKNQMIAYNRSDIKIFNSNKSVWTSLISPINATDEIKLISANSNEFLIVSSSDSIYFSSNLVNWQNRPIRYKDLSGLTKKPKLGYVQVYFTDNVILLSSGPNLYKSLNCGRSWTKVQLPPLADNFQFIHTIAGDSSGVLLSMYPAGLFRSADLGQKWSIVNGTPNGHFAKHMFVGHELALFYFVENLGCLCVKTKSGFVEFSRSISITCKPHEHQGYIFFGSDYGIVYRIPRESFDLLE